MPASRAGTSSSAAYEEIVLRRPRTATRMRCTPVSVARRAAGSSDSTVSRSAASAEATDEVGEGDSGSGPSARASLEAEDEGRAPASAHAAPTVSSSSSPPGTAASTSSTSHSRHAGSPPSVTWETVRTWSSQNSTTAVPPESRSTVEWRSLSIRAIGRSSRRRTSPATAATSSAGTGSSGSEPRGAWISRRPVPAGSLRCQPSSCPPVRRRSVTR